MAVGFRPGLCSGSILHHANKTLLRGHGETAEHPEACLCQVRQGPP